MGTTKVKVIDLSSDQQEVKASRKSAAKMRPAINTEEERPAAAQTKKRAPIATEEAPLKKTEETKAKSDAKTGTATGKSKKHQGVKYQKAKAQIDSEKLYSAKEAIELLGKTNIAKFDPSVEAHLNTNQKNVRGHVSFPHTTGPKKEKKFLVFTDKIKSTDNKSVLLATDSTIDDLVSGRLKPGRDFNGVIASPKYMPQMARVAKILGPAGMMPNPKNGTISEDPEKVISSGESDAMEFRSDPMAPIVHIKIGKLSNKPEELEENLKALITAVGASRIKKMTIKSTMSPGIKVDVNQL